MRKAIILLILMFVASLATAQNSLRKPEKAIFIPHLNKYVVAQKNGVLLIDEDRKSNGEQFKYMDGAPSMEYIDNTLYVYSNAYLYIYKNADILTEFETYNAPFLDYKSLAIFPGRDGNKMYAAMGDSRKLFQVTKPNKDGKSEINALSVDLFDEEIVKLVVHKDQLYIATKQNSTSSIFIFDEENYKIFPVYSINNDPNIRDFTFDADGNLYILFSDESTEKSKLRMMNSEGISRVLIDNLEYASSMSYRSDIKNLVFAHPKSDKLSVRLVGIPPAPQLEFPADKEVLDEKIFDLKWKEIQGVAAYKLEIAEDRDMSVFKKEYYTIANNTEPLKFVKGRTYYWRVQASNMGEIGPWSNVQEFTVSQNNIPAPEPVTPKNRSIKVPLKPYFSWTKIKPYYRFHFQVAIDTTFAGIAINGFDLLESNYQVVHDLKANTKYYWRVKTYANIEDPSSWSEVFTFTTKGMTPTPPKIHYPLFNQVNVERHPRFRWSEVPGAEKYELNISIDANYNHPDSTFFYTIIARPGEENQTFVLNDTILMYNAHYYFRVRAKTEDEQTAWSESRRFQVINKPNNGGGGNGGNGGNGGGGGGDTSSVSLASNFVLYPQPVKDVLFLSMDNSDLAKYDIAGYSVRIINAAGREISTFNHQMLDNKLKIDVSRLDIGVYNLILEQNGKAIISKKFIKE